MKIHRAANVPLILHDPFFSVWSASDHLYDADTVHWCGKRQQLRGWVIADGRKYAFMGNPDGCEVIPQVSVDVTATATEYTFENDDLIFKCRFTSPLLLDSMVLVSRPCTYIDFTAVRKNASSVEVCFDLSADLVRRNDSSVLTGFAGRHPQFAYASMGRLVQQPLSGSDDKTTIDWGYAYLASKQPDAKLSWDKPHERLRAQLPLHGSDPSGLIIAYDDLLSINYFGQWRKAYWTKEYATILDAIAAAFADKAQVLEKAEKLDRDIEEKALAAGGESYAYLCNMSYRHTISAHKLITDEEGNVIFLSKENDSNGCIGTVDVSYPSIPLFMLYDTEYVKGMLRPIFRFAACDVWEFDFAPHDVGRYPYAWGQVYAYGPRHSETEIDRHIWQSGQDATYPPFYLYPAGSGIYDIRYQMPVEECGNMLIMTAAVCKADGSGEFARPHMELLKTWKNYLVKYGTDPGDQLCTDDFAGHLEHNANLSVKAIMGVEAYAMIEDMLGNTETAREHHTMAKEMAQAWEKQAFAGDHYVLAFGKPESWSLKYNLIWDKLWNCGLFSDAVYEKELAYYVSRLNEYGTPLDSRRSYTKSDWIAWCAAMAQDKAQAEALMKPVAHYLESTGTRVPFSDWYDTVTGRYCMFMGRSVQGGIYMPILFRKEK